VLEGVHVGHVHVFIIILGHDCPEHMAVIPVLQEGDVLTEAQVSVLADCGLCMLWLCIIGLLRGVKMLLAKRSSSNWETRLRARKCPRVTKTKGTSRPPMYCRGVFIILNVG